MLVRIVIGILGACAYSLLVFWPNKYVFLIGAALFSCLGANELYLAVRKQGGEPNYFLGYLSCIVFQYAAWTHNGARFAPYFPALMVALVMVTMLYELVKHRARPIVNVGTTLLGGVYAGWLFSYLTLLHGLNITGIMPPVAGTTSGEWMIFFVTAATWLSDSGALFVGKGLGRYKLAPRISPGKTWEGAIGGVLVSLIGCAGLGTYLHIPLRYALGLAALCAISGQIGDLCESSLKRDLGVKDFGAMFPGHGGVLDRIDSLLFAAPLAYYYILFFMVPGR